MKVGPLTAAKLMKMMLEIKEDIEEIKKTLKKRSRKKEIEE